MLGCFNPILGQIWSNPNVGFKNLTQWLSLSIFDPKLGWNNPAFLLHHLFVFHSVLRRCVWCCCGICVWRRAASLRYTKHNPPARQQVHAGLAAQTPVAPSVCEGPRDQTLCLFGTWTPKPLNLWGSNVGLFNHYLVLKRCEM